MVVGLHLHQDLDAPRLGRVAPRARVRDEPARLVPAHDRRVVAICGQHLARIARLRVANHLEQGALLPCAADRPGRVEDLVAAVLGVHLREHHQLRIGRVPAELAEPVSQVVDLRGGQGKAEGGVRLFQGAARVGAEWDRRVGRRRSVEEDRFQPGSRAGVVREECTGRKRALGHAVVEQARAGERSPDLAGVAAGMGDRPRHAALDARHPVEAAVAGDVGGLARPRRDRSRTRRHDDRAGQHRVRPVVRDRRSVEEPFEPLDDPLGDVAGAGEIDPTSVETGDRGLARPHALQEALAAKCRQGGPSPEHREGGGGRGGSRSVHSVGAAMVGLHRIDDAAAEAGR